jgi:hypothetical protein
VFVTTMCKTLGVLPSAGGILDQDPYWVEGMSIVLEAFAEKEQKEAKKHGAGRKRT